ncbi:MAG TPA: helix-turn-helix domain-containing protein [Cyclobacteriaceae bacterium]|jgi:DNA-binding Xre family transcriptional regulator|nr:helix-turn-helix domain-containing protein [Cyclobacteriaceae bacterium]
MHVHIGKEIEEKYHKTGMKLSEFARRINTSSRNVYSIFTREEIKTDQLIKICEVLEFDFFALYSKPSSNIAEPSESYSKIKQKVLVTLELDGQQATLDQHIKKITALNRAL